MNDFKINTKPRKSRVEETKATVNMVMEGQRMVEGKMTQLSETEKQILLLTNIANSLALLVDKVEELDNRVTDIENVVINMQ